MIRFTTHARKRMEERGVSIRKATTLFEASQRVKNYDNTDGDLLKEFWYNRKRRLVFVVRRVDDAHVVCITVIRREAGDLGLAMYNKDVKPIDKFLVAIQEFLGL